MVLVVHILHIFLLQKKSGGRSLVLIIRAVLQTNFEVKLCQDILVEGVTCTIPALRFALCTEDISMILGTQNLKDKFDSADVTLLQQFSRAPVINRRLHALLGQDILKQFSAVKLRGCEVFVVPEEHKLNGWHEVGILVNAVINKSQVYLPEDFDN
jgi:hypothetical protein